MGAAARYPKELLARAWARSASFRMPGAPALAPPAPPPANTQTEPTEPVEPIELEQETDPEEEQFDEETLERARRDSAFFCEFVLTDEAGEPIRNGPHHWKMHEILSGPESRRCAIFAFAESGKTTSISVGRVLWELGHNPNLRVTILCETAPRATGIIEAIAKYITDSARLRAVFPHLRRARKDVDQKAKLKGRVAKWSKFEITVERSAKSRDPSVRASGYGKPVQGARIDLLIADDLVTWETSRTDRKRKNLHKWYTNAIGGRLSPKSRVWVLNTPYHPQDLPHSFVAKQGYKAFSFPARDPITRESLWPEKWSTFLLNQRIANDLGGEGSVEVARQVDCVAKDESAEQFQEAWITKACELGRGLSMVDRWTPEDSAALPQDCFLVTAVDIGLGKSEQSAETVLTTILVYPSGWDEWGYLPETYQILWIEAGRWDGPDILERIYDTHERFGSLVYVESNHAQRWLTQFKLPPRDGKPRPPPPVLPFETRGNKWHPAFGVASLGIDMAHGRFIFPCDDVGHVVNKELAALITEMKTFSPDAHTGDRLMSLWIVREGARKLATGMGGEVDVLG